MKTHRHKERGLTLIEVMATMAVLLVGMLAVAMTVLQTSKQNRRNLAAAQAQIIGERTLERILSEGYCKDADGKPSEVSCKNIEHFADGGVPSKLYWKADGEISAEEPKEGELNPLYKVNVMVNNPPSLDGGLDLMLWDVLVEVKWQESSGPEHAVTLQSRVAP